MAPGPLWSAALESMQWSPTLTVTTEGNIPAWPSLAQLGLWFKIIVAKM
jgi:hypothetical protein